MWDERHYHFGKVSCFLNNMLFSSIGLSYRAVLTFEKAIEPLQQCFSNFFSNAATSTAVCFKLAIRHCSKSICKYVHVFSRRCSQKRVNNQSILAQSHPSHKDSWFHNCAVQVITQCSSLEMLLNNIRHTLLHCKHSRFALQDFGLRGPLQIALRSPRTIRLRRAALDVFSAV